MKQKNVILMVVAVGCGLVAAFLTSQMSARGQVEQVEVVVAAKDLPVGTMITRDDLKDEKVVKIKKVPKDGLPPQVVLNKEDLIDKRLSRPVRTEETFNPQDLSKGGAITLPEGYDMVSLQIGVGNAAAGFIGPGSRVNVNATLRLNNKTYAFPLLVNMLVVAVDTQTTYSQQGTFPSMNTVSFAVQEKQALLLSLAKSRGCTLELLLRHPSKTSEADAKYNIDEVIRLLSDDKDGKADIKGAVSDVIPDKEKPVPPPVEPKPVDVKQPEMPPVAPSPQPKLETKKVLIAKRDIAPGTDVTADLVHEAFELTELPKSFAPYALDDLSEAYGKSFKTGVSQGQWVTPAMVGIVFKPAPQDGATYPKPELTPETPTNPKPAPVQPSTDKPVKVRKFHDVAVHDAKGTVIHRYEEVTPGQWKKIAELTPEQAAKEEPKAAPGAKKLD